MNVNIIERIKYAAIPLAMVGTMMGGIAAHVGAYTNPCTGDTCGIGFTVTNPLSVSTTFADPATSFLGDAVTFSLDTQVTDARSDPNNKWSVTLGEPDHFVKSGGASTPTLGTWATTWTATYDTGSHSGTGTTASGKASTGDATFTASVLFPDTWDSGSYTATFTITSAPHA
jgi:hypothetical protein